MLFMLKTGLLDFNSVKISLRAADTCAPRTPSHSVSSNGTQHKPKGIVYTSLVFLGFFWVCGGNYGIETMVQYAPSFYVFAGLLLIPLFYSLPISLITAELATTFPENGGAIAFIRECFNSETLAWHISLWSWIICVGDSCVYPILASRYATMFVKNMIKEVYESYVANNYTDNIYDDHSTKLEILHWLATTDARIWVAIPCVLFITYFSLRGIKMVVKLNMFLMLVTIVPSLIYVFYNISRVDFNVVVNINKEYKNYDGKYNPKMEYDFALLFSFILWCNAGYGSLGILAGEIDSKNRRSIYLFAIMTLIPLSYFLYSTPLLISLSLDNDWTHYQTGYFVTLAREYVGLWLSYLVLFAAMISLFGVYNGIMIDANVSLQYLMETSTIKDILNDYKLNCNKYFRIVCLENNNYDSDDTSNMNDDNNNNNNHNNNNDRSITRNTVDLYPQMPQMPSPRHNFTENISVGMPIDGDIDDEPETGVRRLWIIINLILVLIIIWVPFEFIIKAEMLLFSVVEILTCIALLLLRIKLAIKKKKKNTKKKKKTKKKHQNETKTNKDKDKEKENDNEKESIGDPYIGSIVNNNNDSDNYNEMNSKNKSESEFQFSFGANSSEDRLDDNEGRLCLMEMEMNDTGADVDFSGGRQSKYSLDSLNETDESGIYRIPCGWIGVVLVMLPPIWVHAANICINVGMSKTSVRDVVAALSIVALGLIVDISIRIRKHVKRA